MESDASNDIDHIVFFIYIKTTSTRCNTKKKYKLKCVDVDRHKNLIKKNKEVLFEQNTFN